ncbi:MAG: M28 family peptidase [Bacteroides sp.]|jgi:Zn-dependent M28 family amino/carboxypeptidase|nr:M28 family peptidase [Bacteroides sp.]MCI1683568.1 M28 family peptidase [Bacteroides sp.]
MRRTYTLIPLYLVLLAFIACSNKAKTASESKVLAETANVPQFNADSAYQYVKAQVDFGPRVPNTKAHVECGNYLAAKLAEFGAQVTNQYADLPAYTGTLLKSRNIIGSYKPESKKRIVLFSHWDSRPWADADPDEKNHYKPILGANDGASGVGVLLEIARQIQKQEPELGIDLIFLDAEDYGAHSSYKGEHKEEYWALGAQYWARNPHVQGYNARFGILLDMVGGKKAIFRYEAYSQEKAGNINEKVWNTAASLGYSQYFVKEEGGEVTDDHVFINEYAGIPTIDIIPYEENGGFYKYWHTLKDDMDAIDKATLQAVGQTLVQVIYNEK